MAGQWKIRNNKVEEKGRSAYGMWIKEPHFHQHVEMLEI